MSGLSGAGGGGGANKGVQDEDLCGTARSLRRGFPTWPLTRKGDAVFVFPLLATVRPCVRFVACSSPRERERGSEFVSVFVLEVLECLRVSVCVCVCLRLQTQVECSKRDAVTAGTAVM